jgi:periplasmic protein CpxP/Spy
MKGFISWVVSLIFCAGIFWAPVPSFAEPGKGISEKQAAAEAAVEDELGLTPEQKDKLKALREDARAKQAGLADDLRNAKSALQKELDSPSPDRKRADNLVASVNKLQSQILAARVDQVFAMRAILTPEQYQKLVQIREERRKEMKARLQKNQKLPAPSPKGKK